MSGVYVNRTLNLKRIRFLGFDMDHTLVRYQSENFEALAHRIMLEKLVSDKNYPIWHPRPNETLNIKLE